MQAINQAFRHYEPLVKRQDYCEDCVSDEMFARILNCIDNPNFNDGFAYRLLFQEPFNCVGGSDNLKYWTPQILTNLLLDNQYSFALKVHEVYQREAFGFWPQIEQDALRQSFSRALLGLVENNNPAPLGPFNSKFTTHCCKDIRAFSFALEAIASSLCALRVNPVEVFQYIFDHRDERIDYYLADYTIGYLIDLEVDYSISALPDVPESVFDCANFLNLYSITTFFKIISKDYLIEIKAKYQKEENELLENELKFALKCFDEEHSRIPIWSIIDKKKAAIKPFVNQIKPR